MRVRRTHALLHDALGALIREKPYDDIVVKEILARANVGRSTFYTHFRDKDELLVSGIHGILRGRPGAGSPVGRLLGFSLPLFEHIDRHRRSGSDRTTARGRRLLHERLRSVLVPLIAEDLRAAVREPRGALPPELVVQHVCSTFVLVLDWWVDTRSELTPAEVDRLFRAMVLPLLDPRKSGASPCQGGGGHRR